ncbi:hypothetical protein [Acaryochloris thomasi]|uniref:hypothetical protein n=1 Tax=Acaryochloris thomasi TaxID=2929456 RepID=UPI001F4319F0|nr:hypothetical protein [Acaryochloris thomasi]
MPEQCSGLRPAFRGRASLTAIARHPPPHASFSPLAPQLLSAAKALTDAKDKLTHLKEIHVSTSNRHSYSYYQ